MMKVSKNKQLGLSLVEIMVALALSAILATALYRIVIANQQGMVLADAYSRTQEVARTTFDLLRFDVRMAGYQGCVNDLSNVNVKLNTASPGYSELLHDYARPVEVVDGYTLGLAEPDLSTILPTGINPVTGSDIFITRSAIASNLVLAKENDAADTSVSVKGPASQLAQLVPGMVMMISHCETGHVFSISNVTPGLSGSVNVRHGFGVASGPDNNTEDFDGLIYPAAAQIMPLNTQIYFIAPNANGTNSLYRYNSLDRYYGLPDQAQELVPFVDDMQLLFSVDTDEDGEPDQYLTASEVEDQGLDMARNVFAVHVDLLIATENACGRPNANNNSCLEPQRFQQVIYIRNSRGRNNG